MQIIDFEKKGNQVRFWLGKNGKQWGDDWNDTPYEHNAGSVYSEFVEEKADINFSFDAVVVEPCDGTSNSDYCKQDMIERKVPCIVVIPASQLKQNSRWTYEDNFKAALDHPKAVKYYFGDEMKATYL